MGESPNTPRVLNGRLVIIYFSILIRLKKFPDRIKIYEPFWTSGHLISESVFTQCIGKMRGEKHRWGMCMDEEELILQFQKYKQEMFLLALSIMGNYHDAEDAVAETMLKAYEKIGSLKNREKFKFWLM